jgi:hypothetical protein
MEQTPNLSLPYILPSQAQKHVTHNEAIRMLDALAQLAVVDRDLAAPPAGPAEGDRYIVAGGASDAWEGEDGNIAAWQDGGWAFMTPRAGWQAWIVDEARLVVHDGSQWNESMAGGTTAAMFGVNTSPDAINRLASSAGATLLTHDGGDHRLAINKASGADTASVVFQTGFSGRAEFGLTGSDHFQLKVSADGAGFRTAMVVDGQTGAATFPATPCGLVNLLINGDFAVNQRGFAGGALAAGIYGHDRMKAAAGGANYTVSGGVISHAGGVLTQIVEQPGLAGTTVTFSVEDLTGGDLSVDIEGQSGTIAAGPGRRGVTLAVPAGSSGNVAVKWGPASGAVSYRRVQLNEGAHARPFERRHPAAELALCQRYFEKTYDIGVAAGSVSAAGRLAQTAPLSGNPAAIRYTAGARWFYRVLKRATPAITIYSPQTGAVANCWDFTAAVDLGAVTADSGSSSVLLYPVGTITANNIYMFHAVADAEL